MRTLIDLDAWVRDATVVARYWRFVWTAGPDDCWYWVGGISSSGHGKLHVGARGSTRTTVLAHRFGFWLRHGPPPWRGPNGDSHLLCHSCDEHSCQNDAHLVPGDHVDNALDWQRHRHRGDWPLADARGRRGRAVAIAKAIVDAGADPAAQAAAAHAAAVVLAPLELHGQGRLAGIAVPSLRPSLRRRERAPAEAPAADASGPVVGPGQLTIGF